MARTSRVWAPAFALRCASEGAEKADPERHGEKFFSAEWLLTWISSWFLFSFCAPTSPAAAPVQAPRAGVSPRRGRAFTTWRVLCFGLSWLVVLLLLSPSAPCPPPAFSSLLVLFSPSFRWLDPPPVSDSLAGFRDPARFLWEDAPAAAEEDAMHGGFREAGRRGWRARLQRRGEPAFAAVAFAPHKRRAPAASLQCFQGTEERGPPASWKSLTFSFLPRATFSVAIERDKFKLSCTQASFCHRYLHWVDLIAKKLPRASASAPPLYSVDVRSLPSRGAARNAEEKTNNGQGQSQEEERDGADSGSRGDEERSHEERSGDSVPTSFVGEKVEVKEKKKEKKEKKEKEKEDEKTKEKKHGSNKGGTEKKKRTGISRSPATVVAFDVVRGSDGLRLEARLAVFVDGIVRLKMREKLNAQQLQREKEKTEGMRAEAPNEPQDVHANVFRLDERFRRYEGYVADVLHLEEDPAEGTEDEAKVTFSTNATVVEFVARPPMSGGHRGEFPRFFPAKMRAAEASCPPTPTVSETSPEKASSEKASEPEPRPAAALKTLEARQSARAFAWHLDGERLLVRVVLQHSPFALRVYLHNKLTQEINEKQLLNWEAFLPVNSKKRGAAEAEGRQQVEERMHMDAGDAVPNALANTRSQVPEELQAAEAARVAEAATGAGVDLREKIKGLRGLEWSVGEVLGENVDEEREVVNDIIMPLFHAGAIHDAVDLYRQGAMEEAFDRFLDSKPFGPTAIGVDVTFWGASQVYGLFEHAAPFPLKSYTEPYRLYNLDVFNYELDSPFSMYASIPFLMAIHAPAASKEVGLRRGSTSRFFEEPENVPQRRGSCGGAAFASREEELRTKSPLVTGFLFLNPTELWVKLRYDQGGEDLPETFAGLNEEEDEDGSDSVSKRQKRSRQRKYQSFASMESMDWEAFQQKRKKTKYEALRTWWTAEGGIFDAIMFLGPTPQDVHRQYHIATGMPAMAPLFALGKHQCRWNYNDQEDVLTVDRGFDEHNIPYDVMWIDIEHTLEKRYFTWDPKTFPEPQKMIESIASKDRKVVAIVDPHLKAVADYYVYREALEGSMLVRNPSGGIFHGHCWSGDSAYADFLSPRTREWWRGLYSYDRYKFSTPDLWVWNDMNEPSVFSGPELSMPKDLLHMGGLLEHREIHNLYGHYHHRSTYEGLMRRGEGNQRPFLLTR
uniref:Glycosyl hydrolase, family 31 protein n=1 Tax=Toxoplasma gondii COUG TaxID=1074873 RepID=A0A2G8XTA3_TOXGO|nr:glycosyl hydrolase, family 31 protein [Toxoplasma gondii COUG]